MPPRADLNVVRVLLAVADAKSFHRAAAILDMDHATVSRKIAALERHAGVPLFTRRTTGAEPTAAGRRLIEAAARITDAMADYERTLGSVSETRSPVSVSAPEGIGTYLLGPQSGPGAPTETPLKRLPPGTLPRMLVLPMGTKADIEITLIAVDGDIPFGADCKVTKLGVMRFKLVASRSYIKEFGTPEKLEDFVTRPLLTHVIYQNHPSFVRYAELANASDGGPQLIVSSSSALHRAVISNFGVTLLPDFSEMLDPNVVSLPFPHLAELEVWISSHPETLRQPCVRQAYTGICNAFLGSPWFRP